MEDIRAKSHEQVTIRTQKAPRMANLELLRCIAMMLVIVLHFLGKGGLLADLTGESLGATGTVAWLLECFAIVAVNVYMLISGYFLCMSSFKLSRLLQLLLQIWFYSVIFGLIGALTGVLAEVSFDTHYLLTLVFPVAMEHYWFMTAYVFLYLLIPFVGPAVLKMSKQQMQYAILFLLMAFSVMKSVLPIRLETDELGYDCLWYLCVFLTAVYMRRFGIPILEKKWRGILLYVVGCLLIFAGTLGLRQVYLHTGSLERILKICLEYNHILPFAAAIGLFVAFSRLQVADKISRVINALAPCTLGVYLLHENIGLRYSWQKWLGAEKVDSVGSLLLWTVMAVVSVFVCGVFADSIRRWIFTMAHKLFGKVGLYRKLVDKVYAVDDIFRCKKDVPVSIDANVCIDEGDK